MALLPRDLRQNLAAHAESYGDLVQNEVADAALYRSFVQCWSLPAFLGEICRPETSSHQMHKRSHSRSSP